MTRVRAVELRLVGLPLVRPFRTSFGEETEKECVLVRLETEAAEGWGECVASPRPDFSGEFNAAAWLALRDHLAPALLAAGDVGPEDLAAALSGIRGNRMAKAALEMAFLDAHLREAGRSLSSFLGGTKEHVPCGVSVGITPTLEELVEQIAGYVAEGYVRVKLKIAPGLDVERVRAVRESFPDLPLSVDANAAYTLDDLEVFRALDELGLVMIEQPLSADDLLDHAELQARLSTPLCLDESIRSAADARAALELRSCRVVNIKQGRVGGLLEARRIHDLCRERDVPVWCGGMLETGLGRAANLALASLPGFTLPGDTSASRRYFDRDLTEPFALEAGGTMRVPAGPGLGLRPVPERLEACTRRREVVSTEAV